MNRIAAGLGLALCLLLRAGGSALAEPGAGSAESQRHIPVTLFGQPCLLKGPVDTATLKQIHAVSPEQIVTPFTSARTSDETRKAIDRLEKATGLPPGLDRYRDKLGVELHAQLAFLDGLEAARKAGSAAPLVAAIKAFLKDSRRKEFEALAAKLGSGAKPSEAYLDSLFDLYGEASETDAPPAEEEFHRAIRRIGVQYACNFDVEDSSSDGEDGDADVPAAPKPHAAPSSKPHVQQ